MSEVRSVPSVKPISDELKHRSIGLRIGIIRAAEAYAIGGADRLFDMAHVAQKELVECGFIKEGQKL